MTKQEFINNAYTAAGVDWEAVKEYVDEDGRCMMYDSFGTKLNPNFQEMGFSREDVESKLDSGCNGKSELTYRPKSLYGIEDNAGWIKIESESDLPSDGYYWTINKNGVMNDSPRITDDLCNDTEYWLSTFTHYQPIVKPNSPLY